ncbi:MAG: hypothetical protein HY093_00550 [Candidatus Liptonbacteria bacterium]|nr:hypothetical protein [Candidatus Liptonbacteria bacterium]
MAKNIKSTDVLNGEGEGEGTDTGFLHSSENQSIMEEEELEIPTKTMKPISKVFLAVLLGALVFSSGSALYFYNKYTNLQNGTIQPPSQASVADETKALLASVGSLIVLPKNESPTIATVADPSQLRDQPFFVNAKKGDKVLIYSTARKAILYSPTQNKIVEVAPVNFENSSQAATPAPKSNVTSTNGRSVNKK